MFPCKNFNVRPAFSRDTSNSLCITTKKNNIFSSTKTIRVGNKLFIIPCFLVSHMEELILLAKTIGVKAAIESLAEKYGVSLKPPIQNIRRYIYPTSNGKLVSPVIQFHVTFKLMETAVVKMPIPAQGNTFIFSQDARYVSVCNDDTITFSTTITDMKNYAKYWISTLPPLSYFDRHYFYAAILSTNLSTAHTGYLIVQEGRLIFLPVINNYLIFLYQPYVENTSFTFLYCGTNSDNAITKIKNLYLPPTSTCLNRIS